MRAESGLEVDDGERNGEAPWSEPWWYAGEE